MEASPKSKRIYFVLHFFYILCDHHALHCATANFTYIKLRLAWLLGSLQRNLNKCVRSKFNSRNVGKVKSSPASHFWSETPNKLEMQTMQFSGKARIQIVENLGPFFDIRCVIQLAPQTSTFLGKILFYIRVSILLKENQVSGINRP